VVGWISTYRSDIEADLADLRAPLAALQSALAVGPAPDDQASRRLLS
jgi:hypothetical protein